MLECCGETFWSSKVTLLCPRETRAFCRKVHGCCVEMLGSSKDDPGAHGDAWVPPGDTVVPLILRKEKRRGSTMMLGLDLYLQASVWIP